MQTLIFVCKLAFCRENPAADIVRVVPKKESNRVLDNTNKGTKTDAYGCQRPPPTAANVRRLGANNAQKMGQIGAGFIQYNPVDFDQFNRLDFDTVVTSGQPSLF